MTASDAEDDSLDVDTLGDVKPYVVASRDVTSALAICRETDDTSVAAAVVLFRRTLDVLRRVLVIRVE